eukprot:UN03015
MHQNLPFNAASLIVSVKWPLVVGYFREISKSNLGFSFLQGKVFCNNAFVALLFNIRCYKVDRLLLLFQ